MVANVLSVKERSDVSRFCPPWLAVAQNDSTFFNLTSTILAIINYH